MKIAILNPVSLCCHAAVTGDIRLEYPKGGRFAIPYKMDRCRSCGREVEEYANACECCGMVGCDGCQ